MTWLARTQATEGSAYGPESPDANRPHRGIPTVELCTHGSSSSMDDRPMKQNIAKSASGLSAKLKRGAVHTRTLPTLIVGSPQSIFESQSRLNAKTTAADRLQQTGALQRTLTSCFCTNHKTVAVSARLRRQACLRANFTDADLERLHCGLNLRRNPLRSIYNCAPHFLRCHDKNTMGA